MNRILIVLMYIGVCQISIANEASNSGKHVYENYLQKLIDNKNYSESLRVAKVQFKIKPESAIFFKIKNIYSESNNSKGWILYLNELKNQDMYNTDVLSELAMFDLKNNDFEQALKKADLIFKTTDKNSAAYDIYFAVFEKQNRATESIGLYGRYIQENSNPELLLRRANQFLNLNDPIGAKKDLQAYLSYQKPTEQTFIIQHEIYQKQENTARVAQNLQDCLSAFPKSEKCFYSLLKHISGQKNKFVLDHYENFQQVFVKNEAILLLVAKQFEISNLNKKAELCYLEISQLNPENFDNLLPMLNFYESNQLVHKSFQTVAGFLATDSKNTKALEYRNRLFSEKPIEAVSAIDKATVEVGKKDILPSVVENGKNLFYSQNYAKLLAHKKLLEPANPNYFFRLGQVYYLSNQESNAVAAWRKVPRTASAYASSVNNLTILMAMSGLKTKAVEYLKSKNAFDSDPAQLNKLIDAIRSVNYGGGRKPSVAAEFKKDISKYLNLDWE